MLTDLEEWLLHPKKTSLESHDTVQVVHPLAVEKRSPNEKKTTTQADICTPMFTGALF